MNINEQLELAYNLVQSVCNNVLSYQNISYEIKPLQNKWGETNVYFKGNEPIKAIIYLNNELSKNEIAMFKIILHEMIHIATCRDSEEHSKQFYEIKSILEDVIEIEIP